MDSESYFDNVASQWDGMRRSFFADSLRDKLLHIAQPAPGMTAADIGAGTGFVTSALVDRGVKVIAVDRSLAMLRELAKKYPQVKTRQGEAESLPVEDGAVDLVFANMYLHHVQRPAVAIAEMTRILKPGGRLVVSDLDRHNHEFLRSEHHDLWMGFAWEDVMGWLSDAGLEEEQVECAGEDCQADSVGGGDKAKVSIFIASGIKR